MSPETLQLLNYMSGSIFLITILIVVTYTISKNSLMMKNMRSKYPKEYEKFVAYRKNLFRVDEIMLPPKFLPEEAKNTLKDIRRFLFISAAAFLLVIFSIYMILYTYFP